MNSIKERAALIQEAAKKLNKEIYQDSGQRYITGGVVKELYIFLVCFFDDLVIYISKV